MRTLSDVLPFKERNREMDRGLATYILVLDWSSRWRMQHAWSEPLRGGKIKKKKNQEWDPVAQVTQPTSLPTGLEVGPSPQLEEGRDRDR